MGCEWEADTWRTVLETRTLECLLNHADPEALLVMTDSEAEELLTAFGSADDPQAWAELRAAQIRAYDASDAVNGFVLDGRSMWLDKATRVGLANSVGVEKAAGRQTTTLWHGTERYELGVDTALGLLGMLEIYALESYNATAGHLAAVAALGDAGDLTALRSYDYRSGYPARLELNIARQSAAN